MQYSKLQCLLRDVTGSLVRALRVVAAGES